MAIERVKCRECDNMVLPQTAAKHGGLCAPCGNTPAPRGRGGYTRRAGRARPAGKRAAWHEDGVRRDGPFDR